MILSLFDQFQSPITIWIPLMIIALSLPWLFFPHQATRWTSNRLLSLQNWFLSNFTQQMFFPINIPGHKWALLLASLMVFLITLNTMGLLPYTFTPTTQLSMNMGFAIPIWLATVVLGMKTQPTHALAHLLPEGTPTPLIPVLIIIETISLFIRPLALGVRLTANLTAGHLLIQLISTAAMVLLSISPMAAILTMVLLFLLTLLEIAVAMIQAYVFALLLSLYLQENV
uniref:ATP synthase subunit a n=1 Tax=Poeciliopsis monacha TaxID=73161 RepID=A0A343A7Z0_9TELE|nr:ATP synthase F0 subunit 6 [Poeciliopsis monacha]YP_010480938.1 ATP synthase F0 subunit 6 [Poeciliopsis monacha x P. lucida]YP_010480951.1 ATP synthase F0 subunit 6 [Poeciliopsis monacha x P. monacha x P. lucida]YP_010480964.1 ATP synthase F0 subunit 6 [Poeciliopsis monacha x P. lucida x P. lucida]YP_010480977.1 ATP synthase F0 subunit 6 [Poeciliopsis monacha x Poeciliopsis latidens]YP_010480990.1 ATP synthase F0 subunit 6 [Poeciliopsis monacha x P. lucida x P. viriosa]APD14637.1 ATP syntha